MKEQKPIDFKVLRKNKYGHRFILEPKERIKFREKCKYNRMGSICEKGYECTVKNGVLIGCTPDVYCPRMMAWDKRHGLEKPYTMVENEFPRRKPISITWHSATESPGKKHFVGAFIRKGRPENQITFSIMRFLFSGERPCETCTEGHDELCVAWAYYEEFIKGITPEMIKDAKVGAWAWWDEETKNIEK